MTTPLAIGRAEPGREEVGRIGGVGRSIHQSIRNGASGDGRDPDVASLEILPTRRLLVRINSDDFPANTTAPVPHIVYFAT